MNKTEVEAARHIEKLEEQRDELVKACELAQKWLVNSVQITDLELPTPCPILATAIANAKK